MFTKATKLLLIPSLLFTMGCNLSFVPECISHSDCSSSQTCSTQGTCVGLGTIDPKPTNPEPTDPKPTKPEPTNPKPKPEEVIEAKIDRLLPFNIQENARNQVFVYFGMTESWEHTKATLFFAKDGKVALQLPENQIQRKSFTYWEVLIKPYQLPAGEYQVSAGNKYRSTSPSFKITVVKAPQNNGQTCQEKEAKKTATIQGQKLDILFVIDDSGSMAPKQEKLGKEVAKFLETLDSRKVDYQIAVVTTDVSQPHKAGCMIGLPKVMNAKTEAKAVLLKNRLAVGITGSAMEKGLEAMKLSLTYGTCSNPKFLRKNSHVKVIVLSDEDDQSEKKTDTYIEFLKNLEKQGHKVQFSTITNVANSSCKVRESSRYKALTDAFSGKMVSICDSEGPNDLLTIESTFAKDYNQTIQLEKATKYTSVTVKVGGKNLSNGQWSLDNNQITLIDSHQFTIGDVVEVDYKILCE